MSFVRWSAFVKGIEGGEEWAEDFWRCSLRRKESREKNVAKREAEAEAEAETLFLVVRRVERRNGRVDSREAQWRGRRQNGGKRSCKAGSCRRTGFHEGIAIQRPPANQRPPCTGSRPLSSKALFCYYSFFVNEAKDSDLFSVLFASD